jgi:hypothetical protein
MCKFIATAIAVAAFLLVGPASGAELWNCTYIMKSHDSRPGHPPPLTIVDEYQVDKDELRLVNGVARYRVTTDAKFGLTAQTSELCDWCTDGPYVITDFVSLSKTNGDFLKTTIWVSKNAIWSDAKEGRYYRMTETRP